MINLAFETLKSSQIFDKKYKKPQRWTVRAHLCGFAWARLVPSFLYQHYIIRKT